jgi:hypothetical protein
MEIVCNIKVPFARMRAALGRRVCERQQAGQLDSSDVKFWTDESDGPEWGRWSDVRSNGRTLLRARSHVNKKGLMLRARSEPHIHIVWGGNVIDQALMGAAWVVADLIRELPRLVKPDAVD